MKVFRDLCVVAEEWVELILCDGKPLPHATREPIQMVVGGTRRGLEALDRPQKAHNVDLRPVMRDAGCRLSRTHIRYPYRARFLSAAKRSLRVPLANKPQHDLLGRGTSIDVESFLKEPMLENLPRQAQAVDHARLTAFVADLSSLENPIGQYRGLLDDRVTMASRYSIVRGILFRRNRKSGMRDGNAGVRQPLGQ